MLEKIKQKSKENAQGKNGQQKRNGGDNTRKFTPLDNSQHTDEVLEYSFPHMARHHFFPLLTVCAHTHSMWGRSQSSLSALCELWGLKCSAC